MRQATYSAEKSIRHNLIYFNVVKKKKKLPSVKNYNCIFYRRHQILLIEKLFTKLFAFVEIIFVSFSKNCRCERRKAEETKGREGGRWKEHVFERIIEEKISWVYLPPPPSPSFPSFAFQRVWKKVWRGEGPRLDREREYISRYWLEWLCLLPLDTVSTAFLHAHAFENNFSSPR